MIKTRVLFTLLLIAILASCTPKSANLTQRESTLLSSQDILDWAQTTRVTILTGVNDLYQAGEVSAETVRKFRDIGQRVESAQRTARQAQESWILATNPDTEQRFVDALENLKDLVVEIKRIWSDEGGE